jgi:nucleoside-diphosphate-sugar epimerase
MPLFNVPALGSRLYEGKANYQCLTPQVSVDWRHGLAKVLVTGGAGYIGSLLTGVLLASGHEVTVVDDLIFGGESLLGYWHHPRFQFVKGDVCSAGLFHVEGPRLRVGKLKASTFDAIVHLAAIVGFPACRAVGKEVAWRYNVEATQRVFQVAEATGVGRFVFASTYSNYGVATDGQPVTEESPLYPQSLYAETKIAAEKYLLGQARQDRCAPLIFRFATLFGISPRTRFDLIVNQFVLEALTKRELVIYQRDYSRAFVHVRDVVEGIILGLMAPEEKVRGQVYNLGSDRGNYTKDEIVALVQKHVDRLKVIHKELSFDGDMRDITVSFAKIKRELGFEPKISLEQGIVEIGAALESGLIKDATDSRYRNAQVIVQ